MCSLAINDLPVGILCPFILLILLVFFFFNVLLKSEYEFFAGLLVASIFFHSEDNF